MLPCRHLIYNKRQLGINAGKIQNRARMTPNTPSWNTKTHAHVVIEMYEKGVAGRRASKNNDSV
jgi:hypothetical protein